MTPDKFLHFLQPSVDLIACPELQILAALHGLFELCGPRLFLYAYFQGIAPPKEFLIESRSLEI